MIARTPSDEPRDAVGLVGLQHALGELDGFVDLAIGQHRQEGAAEQLVVAGIAAQRGAVVGGGGGGVALAAGVPGGEIAAGGGGTRRSSSGACACAGDSIPGQIDGGRGSQCGDGRTPRSGAKGSRLVNSIWRSNAFGAAALG